MNFFFDASISHRVSEALLTLRQGVVEPSELEVIEHLFDRFASNTNDYDWLNTLAHEGGWTIISADARISSNKLQRKVWTDRPITLFVLEKGWKGMGLWDRAWRLIRYWPQVIDVTQKTRKDGVAFRISQSGKITRLD